MNKCIICGKQIRNRNKSQMCQDCFRINQKEEKIQYWKETGCTGCGTSTTLRNCIRDYILNKQNKQCAICGMNNQWNGKEIKFILDHIDGDASNDWENNLRLICPNCDSQLDTYKSRNKHSARTFRHKYI